MGHLYSTFIAQDMQLFTASDMGLNDHRESGPQFYVSSEGRYLLRHNVPVKLLGERPLLASLTLYAPTVQICFSQIVSHPGIKGIV